MWLENIFDVKVSCDSALSVVYLTKLYNYTEYGQDFEGHLILYDFKLKPPPANFGPGLETGFSRGSRICASLDRSSRFFMSRYFCL